MCCSGESARAPASSPLGTNYPNMRQPKGRGCPDVPGIDGPESDAKSSIVVGLLQKQGAPGCNPCGSAKGSRRAELKLPAASSLMARNSRQFLRHHPGLWTGFSSGFQVPLGPNPCIPRTPADASTHPLSLLATPASGRSGSHLLRGAISGDFQSDRCYPAAIFEVIRRHSLVGAPIGSARWHLENKWRERSPCETGGALIARSHLCRHLLCCFF